MAGIPVLEERAEKEKAFPGTVEAEGEKRKMRQNAHIKAGI